MSNDDRVGALETEVARLRDEFNALAKLVLPAMAALSEASRTQDLRDGFLTERLEQLRVHATGDGAEREWREAFCGFAGDVLQYVRREIADLNALTDRVAELERGRVNDLERFGKLLDAVAGSGGDGAAMR